MLFVMEKKDLNKVCFGRGFRKVDPSISAVGFNPAFREKEIAVEIDPVSKRSEERRVGKECRL